jgi:hypothetical protein
MRDHEAKHPVQSQRENTPTSAQQQTPSIGFVKPNACGMFRIAAQILARLLDLPSDFVLRVTALWGIAVRNRHPIDGTRTCLFFGDAGWFGEPDCDFWWVD